MGTRFYRPAALVTALALAVCACDRDRKPETGFEADSRPTFQAHDPYEELSLVDWRPWSDDLFGKSRKPVLLDISGKWCHWCHLYDETVYANRELARYISEHFVPVRVDPDARPDIDSRYNHGGWPTLVVLTPDGDVIRGTTYDPDGVQAFLERALEGYASIADSTRTQMLEARRKLAEAQPFLREQSELDGDVRRKVVTGLRRVLDTDYGGFSGIAGGNRKLASAGVLAVMLREIDPLSAIDPAFQTWLEVTCTTMARGAVHDHMFGGFFRSTEDRAWSIPHFEKLLSVQADMIDLYVLAARRWDDPLHRDAVRSTVDFVMTTLANPDGVTFANAVDPDLGPGDDGSFYTWTVSEVDSLVSPEEAQVFKFHYGIAPSGEVPTSPDRNTIYETYSIDEAAQRLGMETATYAAVLERATTRLRAARTSGPRPRVDTNAYAAANLRVASALLGASQVLDEVSYRERAIATIDFFTTASGDWGTGIPHGYDGKRFVGPNVLEDQVAGLEALIRAYAVTDDDSYLARARELEARIRLAYANDVAGVFWDVPIIATGPGRLMLKDRPLTLNVRMADCLMDLYAATLEDTYKQLAERTLESFAQSFSQSGVESIRYANAVHRLLWELRARSS